ncbi:MAG: ATP-binding protein [Anaerolineae bacterium]|nr:ATP-binding protein [Anaerolineae bacterium]
MPVDLSAALNAEFESASKRGDSLSEEGRWKEAAAAYRQASHAMTQLAQYARDPHVRAKRIERAQAFADLASKAAAGKLVRRKPGEPDRPAAEPDEGGNASDDHTAEIEALITKVPIEWDDIGGLDRTKDEIKLSYALSVARRPEEVKIRAVRNMLFYGPPGTGKTLLAAATSNSLDATFFNVKVSNLLSKYFGESSKLITTLYAVARDHAPAVVFLDEIESLVPPRGSGNDSSTERRVLSTLLVELDGLSQKLDDRFVLTIAATNTPWLIDKAMLSRFEQKIYIPLPDLKAREQILWVQIDKQGYDSEVKLPSLAQRTEGLSGREIERMCKRAINHMIQRCNANLLDVVDLGREALKDYELKIQSLSADDFDHALNNVSPETTATDLKRFEAWRKGE